MGIPAQTRALHGGNYISPAVWRLASAVQLLAAPLLQAAAPVVNAIFPAGGKQGTTFTVTLSGNPGKKPPLTWSDHPGLMLKPGPKPNLYEVSLAADTPPGPHLVRFFTEEGSSVPRLFMVGNRDEAIEAEPNDDHRKPQVLNGLPTTVNGKFDKVGDADSFRVLLEAGKWLVAELQCYSLGSQSDPAMRLLDAQGMEVAMAHDSHNLDPLIAWQVPKSGYYIVQLMTFTHPPAADVTLRGGNDAIYRLTLSQGPYARLAWPPGVRAGMPAKTKPLGWNYGAAMEGPEMDVKVDPSPGATVQTLHSSGASPLLIILNEHETVPFVMVPPPAAPEPLPPVLHGRVLHEGKSDRRPFLAKKGETYSFRVTAATLHSPLDALLMVENAQGKMLVQADDGKNASFDPLLTWKAPADGVYALVVGDRFQRGGWDMVYQISTRALAPTVQATLPGHELVLAAGKTVELKITGEIQGDFPGKLMAALEGLPPGVTAHEVELPAKKGGEILIKVTAAADLISSSQPVVAAIRTSPPDAPATFRARFELRGVEPRGDRLVNDDHRLWLTVQGKPPAPPAATAAAAK